MSDTFYELPEPLQELHRRERFGIITVAMAITWKDDRLWFVPRRWRIGPMPLPGALQPADTSYAPPQNPGLTPYSP